MTNDGNEVNISVHEHLSEIFYLSYKVLFSFCLRLMGGFWAWDRFTHKRDLLPPSGLNDLLHPGKVALPSIISYPLQLVSNLKETHSKKRETSALNQRGMIIYWIPWAHPCAQNNRQTLCLRNTWVSVSMMIDAVKMWTYQRAVAFCNEFKHKRLLAALSIAESCLLKCYLMSGCDTTYF